MASSRNHMYQLHLLKRTGPFMVPMRNQMNKKYSLLKTRDVGMPVWSGNFDVGGYRWKILFYPAGAEAHSGGQHHVSVYLQLLTANVCGPDVVRSETKGPIHQILALSARRQAEDTRPVHCFSDQYLAADAAPSAAV